jgi:hypothetical protein
MIKIKSYCDIVLTWWDTLPSQTWCPYIMGNSEVEYCGPYDDWGYMSNVDNPDAYNLGGDIFNQYVLKYHPEWQLKSSSGEPTMDMWTAHEAALDWGNPDYVKFFIGYFKQVPDSVYNGRWKGTFEERKWNLRFLDNFVIRAIDNNAWNNTPINPRTGKAMTNDERSADVLKAMRTLRAEADEIGLRYFANVYSDVMADYFSYPVYAQLMDLVDYALFEVMVADMNGNPVSESVWLTRVKTAQAIAKNTRAIPVITTEYGDFWYNVATMLLACETGKCMTFQQPIMTGSQIDTLKDLDLGMPVADFRKEGCYIRPWTKGLVAVNPADSGTCSVSLTGKYKELETGNTVRGELVIKNKEGKVLVRE